jgi:hypothetical protein
MNDPGSADAPAPLATDEWPYMQVTARREDRIRRGNLNPLVQRVMVRNYTVRNVRQLATDCGHRYRGGPSSFLG